jgi:hypothetical protein
VRQLVDELLEVVVGECREIRQRFHQGLSVEGEAEL